MISSTPSLSSPRLVPVLARRRRFGDGDAEDSEDDSASMLARGALHGGSRSGATRGTMGHTAHPLLTSTVRRLDGSTRDAFTGMKVRLSAFRRSSAGIVGTVGIRGTNFAGFWDAAMS